MKKTLYLSLIAFVVIFIIFTGCSQNYDMQLTPNPEKLSSSILKSDKIATGDSGYRYLLNEFRTINPRLVYLENTYLLGFIFHSIEENKIGFIKNEKSIPFSNKLVEVGKLIAQGNIDDAKSKINHDLLDKVEKWIVPEHRYSVGLTLEATVFVLSDDYDNYLLNVDYFEYCTELNGYAWFQDISGEKTFILQLEGNTENYLNDPIFWMVADLHDSVNIVETKPGVWKYTDDVRSGCICPAPSTHGCTCTYEYTPFPNLNPFKAIADWFKKIFS
ncbi:hypothetical protein KAU32_05245 [bacterium]|nr:hypothetical protein [bacterium]